MKKLVVIPSEPLDLYEEKGLDWMERYYNPSGYFDEVFAINNWESGTQKRHGMTVIGADDNKFRALLNKIQPHAVRAYGSYRACDYAMRSKDANWPTIVSVHDTNPERIHRSIRYADEIWCVSKAVQSCIIERGVEPQRTRILPNRIDSEKFYQDLTCSNPYTPYPSFKHRILHVGRKTEQKNLDTLIHSLAELPNSYSIFFIGHGNSSEYKSIAEKLGVSDRCVWLDAVKNSELYQWYNHCSVMCTPSRWEGFGIVFIEAAACGAAIITSDIAPMNEFLTHKKSAELVADHENPIKLSEAIKKVCSNDSYRRSLQAGAIEAAKPFHRDKIDTLEISYYEAAPQRPRLSFTREMERRAWKLKGQWDMRKHH